jgi:hypothetical protein
MTNSIIFNSDGSFTVPLQPPPPPQPAQLNAANSQKFFIVPCDENDTTPPALQAQNQADQQQQQQQQQCQKVQFQVMVTPTWALSPPGPVWDPNKAVAFPADTKPEWSIVAVRKEEEGIKPSTVVWRFK